MAIPGGGGAPTCRAWLLLASYVILLGIGGAGVWMSAVNFWREEDLPPTPPPENTTTSTTTTTTTPYPHYRSYSHLDVEVPQEYEDYVDASCRFARILNDARFYLAPLCLVCVAVASVALLAGIITRRIFCSTYSLYSSLGLWILTLTMTIIYQKDMAWNVDIKEDLILWVLGFHIALLLFLPLQIVLSIWELRQQQMKIWPTINFTSLFTAEAILLASRLALAVFTFEELAHSQIFRGLRAKEDPRYKDHYYPAPRTRYPLELALLCYAVACYYAVATVETTLSLLLGKLHHRMTTLTCLLSGLCAITIAVLSSPAFVRVFFGTHTIYPELMEFAIGLSVVTQIHFIACLVLPTILRAPPHILTQIIDQVREVASLDDITAMFRRQGMRGVELLPKKMKHNLHIKAASLILCLISLPVIGVSSADTPYFRNWGHILLLCTNTAILVRIVPSLMMEFFYEEREFIPMKQRLIGLGLETFGLLLGGITVCVNTYFGLGIFGGVLSIGFAIFQMVIMWCLVKETKSPDSQSEDTARLTPSEEGTNEEDLSNPADAMA